MISLTDIRDAAKSLEGVAHRTPVHRSRTLDASVGAEVFCKAECFQRTGTFKFRGAYNAVSRLTPEQLALGVGGFSSGNHAQALALAASLNGSRATIVMPQDTPASKRAATESYGAEIVTYDRYGNVSREVIGQELVAERGLTLIPPYEHPHVMAGQGTVALELIDEVGELDVLVVPVGGGGLMAGCGTVAKALLPDVRLVGVEPSACDDTRQSLEAGERIDTGVRPTIADGLQANVPGAMTFEVNRRNVDEIVLVSEDEMVEAMRFAFERMKIVVEPSGAASLAAVLNHAIADGRVGLVLSGGNIGVDRFVELMGR